MELELEDVVKRRDYKLRFVWGCYICSPNKMWDFVWIYLCSTEQERKTNKSNIHQKCGKGHITRPFKICTKCARVYEVEDYICPNCEHYVRKRTELEVGVENAEKEQNRLKSQLKKKRISKDYFVKTTESLRLLIMDKVSELDEIGKQTI